jgi:O-antigen ligase
MKNFPEKLQLAAGKNFKIILTCLIVTTLYFQTTLADPFNAPKSWCILIFAAWLLGHIWNYRALIIKIPELRTGFFLITAFLMSAAASVIFSDFFYTSLFGEVMRKNGFLSYLSLAVVFLATAMFISEKNIWLLYKTAYFVSILTVIYALIQTTNNDFIEWNNPYNRIITTLGNPNFAGALMAVLGTLIFATLFKEENQLLNKITGILLSIILLFCIYRSNARQGLLAYIIGVVCFIIIWLWRKNKSVGALALIASGLTLIFAIMGMLQRGPLEDLLYKGSVTIRGYYWRAGFEMFKDNPLFGVGLDRYGAYFKELRDVKYPLAHGFEITSTNAHNTFIQFFATGGIFLGISYALLNLFVIIRASSALKSSSGNKRILISGLFSSWVAFNSQSLVSIDNIGISIWGWVLGGALIGISIPFDSKLNSISNNNFFRKKLFSYSQIFISSLAIMCATILIGISYRAEINASRSMMNFNSVDEQGREIYRDLQLKAINSLLIDPTYALTASMNLVNAGFAKEGTDSINRILLKDPRNLDALRSLALINEQLGNINIAINYRKQISDLDPWNASNLLSLGKDYKLLGDSIKTKEVLVKILSFASKNEVGDQAKIELAN